MKCFSLFSGIGGFDLAARNLGYTTVGACEIDKYAKAIYKKAFPKITIHKDATKIIPGKLPDFDVLFAGFPCQSFSIAGKRKGFEDTRGTLFFEIIRIARKKQPRYILLENVKGLLSHQNGDTARKIFSTLDELGYDTQSCIVNTKDFLPQNRERIFIVATLRGQGKSEIFSLKKDEMLLGKKKRQKYKIRSEISSTIDAGYHSLRNCGETYIIPTITGGGNSGGMHSQMTLVKMVQGYEKNQTGRVYDSDGIARTMCAGTGGMGKNTGLYNVKGAVRRLTPTECEKLQGFPVGYTKYGIDESGEVMCISDTQRYRSLGNAVTVPVAQYVMNKIK
jgi:DNA (cytosine-5)-methyltransferase 1